MAIIILPQIINAKTSLTNIITANIGVRISIYIINFWKMPKHFYIQWKMLKDLCDCANVARGKVFPYNFPRLFARTFYPLQKDIVRIADLCYINRDHWSDTLSQNTIKYAIARRVNIINVLEVDGERTSTLSRQ